VAARADWTASPKCQSVGFRAGLRPLLLLQTGHQIQASVNAPNTLKRRSFAGRLDLMGKSVPDTSGVLRNVVTIARRRQEFRARVK
jgi:hypothetical protein